LSTGPPASAERGVDVDLDWEVLRRIPHHTPEGRFRNPWPGAEPRGLGGLLRWILYERMVRLPHRDLATSGLPPSTPRLGTATSGDLAVTWLGHSTVLLELGTITALTDPIWGDRASPLRFGGPRRLAPAPLPLEELPRVDIILLSHNHYDHLDRVTVERLAVLQRQAVWLVPLRLGKTLRRFGVRETRELDWWDECMVLGARVGCTPAQHFSARSFSDRNQTLWCGWTLGAEARRVFFAGDTGYHPEFAGIARRFGPFDVVLLPVGAYEPRWFMRPVHMNPEEAVQAYRDLATPLRSADSTITALVPIHWGTFRLTDEPLNEPPTRTRQAWVAAGLPERDLWVLAQGETRALRGVDAGAGGRPGP